MQLLGKAVQEKELTGNETLAQLVGVFTTKEGALKEDVLPGTKPTVRKAIQQQRAQDLQTIERLATGIYMPSERNAVQQALQKLQTQYVLMEFDELYDGLSPQMFDLQRQVTFSVLEEGKRKPTKYKFSIPLFITSRFGETGNWIHNETRKPNDRYSGVLETICTISARVPPLTSEVKKKAQEARAIFIQAYATALRTPVIGDLLMADTKRFERNGGLTLDVAWIPSASELEIQVDHKRDPDPILVARVYGRNYLIASWDVKGEEPFQHYLQEFTE